MTGGPVWHESSRNNWVKEQYTRCFSLWPFLSFYPLVGGHLIHPTKGHKELPGICHIIILYKIDARSLCCFFGLFFFRSLKFDWHFFVFLVFLKGLSVVKIYPGRRLVAFHGVDFNQSRRNNVSETTSCGGICELPWNTSKMLNDECWSKGCHLIKNNSMGFSGTPNNGTPWAPYYSHTTPHKNP